MERLFTIYGECLVRWRWLNLIILIAFSVLPLLGWLGFSLQEQKRSRWDTDQSAEIVRENERFEEARNTFSFRGIACALVLESDDFFTTARRRAIGDAVSKLYELGLAGEVTWVGSIPQFSDWATDETQPELDEAIRNHPLVKDQLLSRDESTMLIHVVPASWDEGTVNNIRSVTGEIVEPAGMSVRMTGTLPLNFAHDRAFETSHQRVIRLAVLVVVVIAIVVFRNFREIIIVCMGPGLGVFWALGLFMLTGFPTNELSEIILPVMLLMIGFTDSVHLVIQIRRQRLAGDSPSQAAVQGIRKVGPACWLTSLTTAIGFGSLILSRSEVITGFGRSAAIGVLIMLIAVVGAVPLFTVFWIGRDPRQKSGSRTMAETSQRTDALLRTLLDRARPISFLAVTLIVVWILFAMRLQPDDRLRDRIPSDTEAWQALNHCDEAFGGIVFLEVIMEWPADVSATEQWEVLRRVEELLEQEPMLSGPLSIRTWLSVISTEQSPANLAMARLLPSTVRSSFWQPSLRRTLIVARMQDQGLVTYDPILAKLSADLEQLSDQHEGFRFSLTGLPVYQSKIVRNVVRDLFKSLMTAGAIIFVVLTISFGSLRLGLISIIPNLFPLAAAAALRASFGESLDISSACAFVICLGIAVDDTIHYMWRYRFERKQGGSIDDVLVRTTHHVGKPLVLTTTILVFGIGTVLFSEMPTHRYFATMACTTLAAALAGDLLVLPAVLKAWGYREAMTK